jgi:hypothetical protein
MRWTNRFRTLGEVESANVQDATVIDRTPYDGRPETPAAPGDHPEAHIADEIKRRQIALAVRYVAAVRAR